MFVFSSSVLWFPSLELVTVGSPVDEFGCRYFSFPLILNTVFSSRLIESAVFRIDNCTKIIFTLVVVVTTL